MVDKNYLMRSEALVRYASCDSTNGKSVEIQRAWEGHVCKSTLKNFGNEPAQIKEIVLFKGPWEFDGNTAFYGEGYNMLSQYGGTLSAPEDWGSFNDHDHYKMPKTHGYTTVYNMMLLLDDEGMHTLLAFISSHRFRGEIRFNEKSFEIIMDAEGLTIGPEESWQLESFYVAQSEDRNSLLRRLGQRINEQHPLLTYEKTPAGWCSWYSYGPTVTEQNIFDNMNAIDEQITELEFIQIDDGYQAYMGDWLVSKPTFATDIKELCRKIKAKGFKPAIWVAPFIAEKDSALFKEHPDWFVKDEDGKPLPSDRVSFGGWRHGPWYMLDGTHPDARAYITYVFNVMKEEWGCEYFKLDANNWGALPFGKRYDENATSVQAYRMGMAAVLEGAGKDSFVLGCNAPMWPSLGLVHGMRVSNDIYRKWQTFKDVTKQCFLRNWQHKLLWINDPDCIVLDNLEVELVDPNGKLTISRSDISDREFDFHAAAIMATGGMVLSGDVVFNLSEGLMNKLKRIAQIPSSPAEFDDNSFTIGRGKHNGNLLLYVFNWNEKPLTVNVAIEGMYTVKDFWSGDMVGVYSDSVSVEELPAHGAVVYECLKV